MKKIKLFCSYSHKDARHRDDLTTHLAILKQKGLIDQWDDTAIGAGDDFDEEIKRNMQDAHIILFLISPHFLESIPCQKEVKKALSLRNECGAKVIPIILRPCPWEDCQEISSLIALPKDARPITKWTNADDAWKNVYDGIKKEVEKVKNKMVPQLRDDFRRSLLDSPSGFPLEDLFVFPDVVKSGIVDELKRDEIDSAKIKDIRDFSSKFLLIEGDEQSGKTSLCHMLYLHYADSGLSPILVDGKNVTKDSNLERLLDKNYKRQYQNVDHSYYINIPKENRILLVDDLSGRMTISSSFLGFSAFIKEKFEYCIIFIDKTHKLSGKIAESNYFSDFQDFSISEFGYKKRTELVKRCISYDQDIDFNHNDNKHLAILDRTVKHVDNIMGKNIVPSYPVFLVVTFFAIESALGAMESDKTSYGHCYHAMLTLNLGRAGIKGNDVEAYFNFLTELAYFMFKEDMKSISEESISMFIEQYRRKFIIHNHVSEILASARILKKQRSSYTFNYIYIYYYFVARYIASKMDESDVKKHIENLMNTIHRKDSGNIIVFITHHTNNREFLDEIMLAAMSTFDKFPEAKLSGDEKSFIYDIIQSLGDVPIPDKSHDVQHERDEYLKNKDKLSPVIEEVERENEKSNDPLIVEIRKSTRSIEIIGQILKNQYGSLEKKNLEELFKEGQSTGLRVLGSYMHLVGRDRDQFEKEVQSIFEDMSRRKNLSAEESAFLHNKIVFMLSFGVVLGCLHKISDSLGYDKILPIADSVNSTSDTVASKLVNLSIHLWHAKDLNVDKIKMLFSEFKKNDNKQAVSILRYIVATYLYKHHVDDIDKQKIHSLFDFDIKRQRAINPQSSKMITGRDKKNKH